MKATFVAPHARLPGVPPVMVWHDIEIVAGELRHYSSGELRAVVPPDGFADYAAAWPQAAEVIQAHAHAQALARALEPEPQP